MFDFRSLWISSWHAFSNATQCLRFSKNFKIWENHQRRWCAWVGLADFANFFKQREPHPVLSKVVFLCWRVTLSQKIKIKKSGKFLHYTLTCSLRRTGEICSPPTQIFQDFTAISCCQEPYWRLLYSFAAAAEKNLLGWWDRDSVFRTKIH